MAGRIPQEHYIQELLWIMMKMCYAAGQEDISAYVLATSRSLPRQQMLLPLPRRSRPG